MRFGGGQWYVNTHLAFSGGCLFRSNGYNSYTMVDQFDANGNLIRNIPPTPWGKSVWAICPDFDNTSIFGQDVYWISNGIAHLDDPQTGTWSWFATISGVPIQDMYMCPDGPLFVLGNFNTGQTVPVVKISSDGTQELLKCQIPSDPDEMPQGYFNGGGSVAADQTNGRFYIAAIKNWEGNIFKYDSSGTRLGLIPLPYPTSAPDIDVDSNGNIYISDIGSGDIRVLSPDGTLLKTISVPDAEAIIDFLIVPGLPNETPVADPGGPYSESEGSQITFDGTGSSDPDGDGLSYSWDFGDGSIGTGVAPLHAYPDNGEFTVCLTVTDTSGATDTQFTTATINNVAPTVGPIDAPVDPVQLGVRDVCAMAEFVDMGEADTHTAEWDWGDWVTDPGTVDEALGYGSVYDCHAYTQAGIYTITLTVTDDDGDYGESEFKYVVVYYPDGGFVTGGGWIDSPAGAYAVDPALSGKANFGFVSKYKKGANVPTGNTEFVFKTANLNFHSSSYDWLVVTGSDYARFKGAGTINGMGDYKFMLWAGDDDPDTFRIRIWTEDDDGVETDVYDNGSDQAIGGGSIVIHAK
jgi:PKD repeat protein